VNTVLEWFGRYGYYAVFFPVLLEPVGLPFPAETILLAGGATAKLGHLDLVLVIGIAFAAALIGGTLGWGIGVYGGKPLIDWGVRHHLVKQVHIDRVAVFFERHGGKTLVFVRFIPGVRIPTFWMAGASGMPLRTFTIWNLIGAAIWTTILVLLGYAFASSVDTISRLLGRDAALAAIVVFGIGVSLYLLRKRLRPE
jgi:membrane protein DedA with SNARE-associated domain